MGLGLFALACGDERGCEQMCSCLETFQRPDRAYCRSQCADRVPFVADPDACRDAMVGLSDRPEACVQGDLPEADPFERACGGWFGVSGYCGVFYDSDQDVARPVLCVWSEVLDEASGYRSSSVVASITCSTRSSDQTFGFRPNGATSVSTTRFFVRVRVSKTSSFRLSSRA